MCTVELFAIRNCKAQVMQLKWGSQKKGNAAVAVERSQLVTPEGTEKKNTHTV